MSGTIFRRFFEKETVDLNAPSYDLAIIGGGINGCGIARDAAGRGLSVFLCERDDLACGASSASTKLIHGGLRYLEYYEFRLVREALQEREVLLRAAPHIIWPLQFILPHHNGLRPAWLIRTGLFLYDHIGGRKMLPGTRSLDLRTEPTGKMLKSKFTKGFEYSDCWVIDSRLVVLNAMDAARLGAHINTRTPFLNAKRENGLWLITVVDPVTETERRIQARALVNASGPWMGRTLSTIGHNFSGKNVRMVKGSHIIVKRLFSHNHAYIFQNSDGRIIFAIPFAEYFTLIGTTDVDYCGNPDEVAITTSEVEYLCAAASEYISKKICPSSIVSSYSGIRPLFDDGKRDAKAVTRDYAITLDSENDDAPLISIYGGKITTYRKLAETVMNRLRPFLPEMGEEWTKNKYLPGGNFSADRFEEEVERLRTCRDYLSAEHARRLFRYYGTIAFEMIHNLHTQDDLGEYFGADLYQFEVEYLMRNEWAKTAEDIIRRRTMTGLLLSQKEIDRLQNWMLSQKNQL